MGQRSWPPDMCRSFAALLTIWSIARMAKFQVIISTTGRRPTIAAPTPRPVKPSSEMGASMMRALPNRSSSPCDTLKAPW